VKAMNPSVAVIVSGASAELTLTAGAGLEAVLAVFEPELQP